MTKTFVAFFVGSILAQAAAVIDTFPGAGVGPTAGWAAAAQTITIPVDNLLVNYRFSMASTAFDRQVEFSVVPWDVTGPAGPAVFSRTLDWGAAGGPIDVLNINTTLISGQVYGFVVDFLGYEGESLLFQDEAYGGGSAWWRGASFDENTEFDHVFRAEFESTSATPEPYSVVLTLSGLGFLFWRRAARDRVR